MLLQALHILQQFHSNHLGILFFMTYAVFRAHSNTIHCLIRLFVIGHIGISRSLTSTSIPLRPSTRPTTSHRIPRTKLKAAHLADPLINIHPIIVIVLFVVQLSLRATASPGLPLVVCVVIAVWQDVHDGIVDDFLTFFGECVACASCGVD